MYPILQTERFNFCFELVVTNYYDLFESELKMPGQQTNYILLTFSVWFLAVKSFLFMDPSVTVLHRLVYIMWRHGDITKLRARSRHRVH